MSEFNRFFVNSDDLSANGSIQLAASINMKKMRVERFTFFNTAYNVHSKVLRFTETTDLDISLLKSIPLADGFYEIADFIAYLKTVLDANSSFGWSYTITLNATTSKITITANANPLYMVKIDFDGDADIRQLLGFKADTTGFVNSVVSPFVPQAQPLCIYLLSNLGNYSLRQPYHTYNTSLINDSILLVVDIDSAYGTIVKYENRMPEFYEVDTKHSFNQLWFKLVDQNSNEIDLQGSQFRLELGYYA